MKYFQGREVAHSSHRILLSQKIYFLDLLAETILLGVNPLKASLK